MQLLLFLRPIFLIFFMLMILGYGSKVERLLFKRKETNHLKSFSSGLAFLIFAVFTLGFLGLYQTWIFLVFYGLGVGLAFSELRELKKTFDKLIQYCKANWGLTLMVGLVLLLMLIRSHAPIYFIDTCQYHLALCDEYLRMGGIVDLPHNFFYHTVTTFFPESVCLIILALMDDYAVVQFGVFLAMIVLLQLYRLLALIHHQKTFPIVALTLLGCEAFFQNVIFAKTETLVLLFLIEVLCRWLDEEKRTHFAELGFFMGMLSFCKISMAITSLCLILAIGFASIKKRTLTLNGATLFCACFCIPVLFWVGRNMLSHGMPLFPFIHDPELVPQVMQNGVAQWMKASPLPLIDKIKQIGEVLFLNRNSYGFKPLLFVWICSLSFVFCSRKRYLWMLSCWFVVFVNMVYWLTSFPYPNMSFRLSFPSWIFSLLALAMALKSLERKAFLRRVITILPVISIVWLLYNNSRYLPGSSVHLGKVSLSEYYRINSPSIGEIGCDKKFMTMKTDGTVAVFSEFPHLVKHPKATSYRLSKVFDGNLFHSVDTFMKNLNREKVEYLLIDHDFIDLTRRNLDSNHQYIALAIDQGFLQKVRGKSKWSLLRNIKFKSSH